jgi:hypothetical protein
MSKERLLHSHDNAVIEERDESNMDNRRCDLTPMEFAERPASQEGRCLFTASLFILLAVSTWVTEIEVTRILLGPNDQDGSHNNAYAMMWMAHNLNIPFGFGASYIMHLASKRNSCQPSLEPWPLPISGSLRDSFVRIFFG